MRTRLGVVVAVVLLALLAGASVATGDRISSGQYFGAYVAPTQGGSSAYDYCGYYVDNEARWPGAYLARTTYIDNVGYHWHFTVTSSSSPLDDIISLSQSEQYTFKEYCQNADPANVYYLACYYVIDYPPGSCT